MHNGLKENVWSLELGRGEFGERLSSSLWVNLMQALCHALGCTDLMQPIHLNDFPMYLNRLKIRLKTSVVSVLKHRSVRVILTMNGITVL